CAAAGPALSASDSAKSPMVVFIIVSRSKHVTNAAGHSETGKVDRLEARKIRSEISMRPQVARFGAEVDAARRFHIDAAEYVRVGRPAGGLEGVREHRVIKEVDEIAFLMELVVRDAAAGAHKRR